MSTPTNSTTTVLVIGIGNAWAGDDAAGLLVARQLKEQLAGLFQVLEQDGDGASLMEAWRGVDAVILVDASSSGVAPGTVRRFDASAAPLPAQAFRHSSHAFSLPEAIELARTLGELPQRVIVYSVEGGVFAAGAELSPQVEKSIEEVVARVREEARLLGNLPPSLSP